MAHDTLPRDARIIALLIAANPSIKDAHPAVLHQLLEFSHRYTSQVLSDALVYAEHAGRAGVIQQDDVALSVQARVGWEMGGPVPKEHLLALATKTNAQPLPSISDTYGTRIPPAKHALTSVDFDIVPNKPPPGMNDPETYEEEYEEWEEDDTPDAPPAPPADDLMVMDDPDEPIALVGEAAPMQNGGEGGDSAPQGEDDDNDGDDLFGDGEGDDDGDKMDQDTSVVAEVAPSGNSPSTGIKRKIEEDDDYD